MKNQALFSSKDKSKKLKRRLLQFLFCALMVKGKAASSCFFFRFSFFSSFLFTKKTIL